MNVEIGTEAPLFLFWEYLFQIFGIFSLQCTPNAFIFFKCIKILPILDRFDEKPSHAAFPLRSARYQKLRSEVPPSIPLANIRLRFSMINGAYRRRIGSEMC
jgi:hypothetical protein